MTAAATKGERWLADRMRIIQPSGIRRVSELARDLKDPVDLSIGQPQFDVPEPIKDAAKAAMDAGRNGYTATAGVPELLHKIRADVKHRYGHADREVFITSGSSGGMLLALCCTVNPGDEVILFDPCFLMYAPQVTLAGGKPLFVDTYPDFVIDLDKVRAAISPRTKAILVNSPANPSGAVVPRETMRELALLARDRGLLLLSDEVYRVFCYDEAFVSPAEFSDECPRLRRLQQSLWHDRLALGFYTRAKPRHSGDAQTPTLQLRVCAEHGPICRRRRVGL